MSQEESVSGQLDKLKLERSNSRRLVTRKENELHRLLETKGNKELVDAGAAEFEKLLKDFLDVQGRFEALLTDDEEKKKAEEYSNEVRIKEPVLMNKVLAYLEEEKAASEKAKSTGVTHQEVIQTNENKESVEGKRAKTIRTKSCRSGRSRLSVKSAVSVAAQRAALQAEAEALAQKEELDRKMLELQQKSKRLEMTTQMKKLEAEEAVLRQHGSGSDSLSALSQLEDGNRTAAWVASVQQEKPTEEREDDLGAIATTRAWDTRVPEFKPTESKSPSMVGSEAKMVELLEAMHMPRTDILRFDGDPLKYWSFIMSFDNNVDRYNVDEHAKLARLLHYCTGRAYKVIEGCAAMQAGGYARAKELLKERFGNDYLINSAWVNKVVTGPKVGTEVLQEYADELRCFKETLGASGSLFEVNQQVLLQIMERLPVYAQHRWKRKVLEIREQRRNPQLEELVLFVERLAKEAHDPVFGNLGKIKASGEKSKAEHKGRSFSLSTSDVPPSTKKVCAACGTSECVSLFKCAKFLRMTPDERFKIVKEGRLCFNCLRAGHGAKNCRSDSTCSASGCRLKHTKFLHGARPNNDEKSLKNQGQAKNRNVDKESVDDSEAEVTCGHAVSKTVGSVALPIVRVSVTSESSGPIETYALLDSGSTSTFCSSSLVKRLGSRGTKVSLRLTTLEKKDSQTQTTVHQLTVTDSTGNNSAFLSEVYARSNLPVSLECLPTTEDVSSWSHLRDLDLPKYDASLKVELLIGQDNSDLLMPLEVRRDEYGDQSAPFATRSLLGWMLNGPISRRNNEYASVGFISSVSLEEQVQSFWKLEGMNLSSDSKGLSCEDREALRIMDASIRKEDGHYEVAIPFRVGMTLPDNRSLAVSRLQGLKRKLERNPKLFESYSKQMNDLIRNGFAEEVPENVSNDEARQVWYIPHHAVIQPKKSKVRIVFDCAAQFKGQSLNKAVLQGPDLTNKLIGILLRFRQSRIALSADVEAMFHQVRVPTDQRDMLRFLWWKDGNLDEEPNVYRMSVHLFGGTWSPSACSYAMQQTAKHNQESFPLVVTNAVLQDFYVDDFLKSVETVEEATQLVERLRELLKDGGFRLCKWLSNNMEVLKTIPEEERSAGVRELNDRTLPVERTLGVSWNVGRDSFTFQVEKFVVPTTRRQILSLVCSIYDPFGFLTPFTVKGKKLLQDLARMKYDWDETVPETVLHDWSNWIEDMKNMEQFVIPRCISSEDARRTELHHFSDASTMAYGAVSYVRQVDANGLSHTNLLYSRSRIAPLKSVSIPRLELAAATLSVQQDEMIRRELSIEVNASYFWTDSSIVLAYINNPNKRFHTYVANRLAIIQDGSSPDQWKHVKSELNPADDISRGSSVLELLRSRRWIHGPEFLEDLDESAFGEAAPEHDLEGDPEVKIEKTNAMVCQSTSNRVSEFVRNVSSWEKAKTSVAVCLRFIELVKSKGKMPKSKGDYRPCTVQERLQGEQAIIRIAQDEAFGMEITDLISLKTQGEFSREEARKRNLIVKKHSCLYRLDPFLDHNRLLRVGGRLRRGSFQEEVKHPVILPKRHPVTELIVRYCHEKCGHQGRGMTLQELRQRGYWVVKGSSSVARVVSQCVHCRKLYNAPQGQRMSDLPKERVESSPPFTHCGVDVFGPFLVKEGRKELKRYAVLFTCLASRAVHVEVATRLSTDAFINALRRITALRGPIRSIHCDQGTNFVGASNELKEAQKDLDKRKVAEVLANEGCDLIEFQFNPPASSHMGGVWERQIRSIRRILAGLLQQFGSQISDEGLRTVMYEASSIVNSRPLTVDSQNDPTSPEPLSPNLLLTQKAKTVLPPPPGEFQPTDIYSSKQWRRVQYVVDQFWKRWRLEYLQNLQSRQKWNRPRRNLAIGDIVVVRDDNLPRNQWLLGRVEETKPGEDGLVRKVLLRVADRFLDKKGRRQKEPTFLERPVHKLVLLLPQTEQNSNTND